MGLRFRRSKKLGPFRFTLGKGTVSGSVGIPGLRWTLNSKGRRSTTASVPGTGLYWTETERPPGEQARRRKPPPPEPMATEPAPTETAPIEPAPTAPPPGWRPDPTGAHEHRWWSGAEWTEHVADRGRQSVDPPLAARDE